MRVLVALALCCTVVGCYGEYYSDYGHGTATVAFAPPAPIVETPPPPPLVGEVWLAGSWAFYDQHWVWAPGRWARPPRPGVVYYPPTWQRRGEVWVRVPGRWVAGQAVDRSGRRVWFDAAGSAHYF